MDYKQTGLPDHKLLREAFNAGWQRFRVQAEKNGAVHDAAEGEYLRGPVELARLILRHGGDCRMVPAAAGLAGPAAFSGKPSESLSQKIVSLAREVMQAEAGGESGFRHVALGLSPDARLFLQVSAIMFVDRLSSALVCDDAKEAYLEALKLYSAARGERDVFGLDTRFEVAMSKAQMALDLPRPLASSAQQAPAYAG